MKTKNQIQLFVVDESNDDTTTVVNLKNTRYDVYIGRKNSAYGLPKSFWHNEFDVKTYGRAESIRLYENHILNSPEHLNRLHELKGKTLGCWCKPLACHGDVLIRLMTNLNKSAE
jgi:hypothetical protein